MMKDETRARLVGLAAELHPDLRNALLVLVDADSRANEVARLQDELQRAHDLTRELRRHLHAREKAWRDEAVYHEREYVAALNAVLAAPHDNDPDVHRWRGHAEARRIAAARARRQAGDPEPEYRSAEWRAANGVYSEERVRLWRAQERA